MCSVCVCAGAGCGGHKLSDIEDDQKAWIASAASHFGYGRVTIADGGSSLLWEYVRTKDGRTHDSVRLQNHQTSRCNAAAAARNASADAPRDDSSPLPGVSEWADGDAEDYMSDAGAAEISSAELADELEEAGAGYFEGEDEDERAGEEGVDGVDGDEEAQEDAEDEEGHYTVLDNTPQSRVPVAAS